MSRRKLRKDESRLARKTRNVPLSSPPFSFFFFYEDGDLNSLLLRGSFDFDCFPTRLQRNSRIVKRASACGTGDTLWRTERLRKCTQRVTCSAGGGEGTCRSGTRNDTGMLARFQHPRASEKSRESRVGGRRGGPKVSRKSKRCTCRRPLSYIFPRIVRRFVRSTALAVSKRNFLSIATHFAGAW